MGRATRLLASAAAVGLLLAAASPAAAHGRHGHPGRGYGHIKHRSYKHSHYGHRHHGSRVVIGLYPYLGWGPGVVWWGPPYVYRHGPPRVIVEEPPVYIQRPPTAAAPEGYWYYCESAGRYYPSVPTCPEPWIQVPPRPE